MIGRVRKHTALGDDFDPGGLHVFIPGALASGFLVSIGLLVGDAMRKLRGDAGNDRKVQLTGAAVADEVRSGAGASRTVEAGLRSRRVYGIVGSLALALAVAVVPGAAWNFLNPVGYIADIGWIWALSMLGVLALVFVGVRTIRLAPEWLPIFFLVFGAAVVVRFWLGREPGTVRLVVIIGAVIGAVVGAALTWRLRKRRQVTDVPPKSRRLLRSTPLARIDD